MRLTRPTRRAAALAGAAALAVSGALIIGIGLTSAGAPASPPASSAVAVPTTTSALPTVPEPAHEPAPSTTPAARYTPSSTVRLLVPSVGLNLPLLSLTPRRGVIDPPLLTAGYWIEPYGAPVGTPGGATNTLYLAAHSAGSGDDGFDPLLTADHRGSAVAAGDTVEVSTPQGSVTYTVERTQRYAKNQLADAAEVWEAMPGRLVLITCFQRADGRNATENLVVFARS